MKYDPKAIESKWQAHWKENKTFEAREEPGKVSFYVLDMFPYPSGAGLHVGHPLGYIASDIYARYKRLLGFNVLHPMGYDAFGLPAEQYAIQTGQHPAKTTRENIDTYRRQLDQLGFSYDWSREVRTCEPEYYKWTQWIFLQLFDSWYNKDTDKAEPISSLRSKLAEGGTDAVNAACSESMNFSADEWEAKSKAERNKILLNYRLAYLSEAMVNWCPELGTVLANDEVKDGVSERGGYPVVQKKMKQWSLRITAYAQRLLDGLGNLDWSDSMKDMQRNWIGRSKGAEIDFVLEGSGHSIKVFTTRPDTIFGATFMVLAPEHELVKQITTPDQSQAVERYVDETSKRSERDRMADTKSVTGCFTGAYAINPFTETKIPVWIADYVLSGYGTGAIMAVPSGDERDWNFASTFDLDIIPVIEGQDVSEGADERKDGTMINSGFMNGMQASQAIGEAIRKIEDLGIGKETINYKLRDAIFGRQRYWGEPIPIYYEDDVPYALPEQELPLVLPEVDKFLPTEDGEPPLARAADWKYQGQFEYEHTTMPGWAGSSWYYLRYQDAKNENEFASKEKLNYWGNVDLYIGGAEHATGHLLYVRFWTKVLYDLGHIPFDEMATKLINQGMIGGTIEYVYLNKEKKDGHHHFLCSRLAKERGVEDVARIPVPIKYVQEAGVEGAFLNRHSIDQFVKWMPEYADAMFECSAGIYQGGNFTPTANASESHLFTHSEVGKMSKRYHNTVDPVDIVEKYGADCLRLYEMFLGPLEDHKPWNTQGIDGVSRFLKKFWRLFYSEEGEFLVKDETPSPAELKVLHQTIRKVKEDLERYSFNTVVSTLMICVNDLQAIDSHNKSVLADLLVLISSYAPHLAEELWQVLGNSDSISTATFPEFKAEYVVEDSFSYPVSFNGKMRFKIELGVNLSKEEIEQEVLACEQAQKYLEGKSVKKVIVVPKRIVNVVV